MDLKNDTTAKLFNHERSPFSTRDCALVTNVALQRISNIWNTVPAARHINVWRENDSVILIVGSQAFRIKFQEIGTYNEGRLP